MTSQIYQDIITTTKENNKQKQYKAEAGKWYKKMKNEYTIAQMEKSNTMRQTIHFNEKNAKGEKIAILIMQCKSDLSKKNALGNLWAKHGSVKKPIDNWLGVVTEVTEADGNIKRAYNPQHDKNRQINFDWMLEATEENRKKIIDEVFRLANL